MTTKMKILLGFTLVLLVLIGVALVGYRGLHGANDNFTLYNRLSRASVLLSDLIGDLAGQSFELERYMATREPENAQNAISHIRTASERMIQLREYIVATDRQKTINKCAEEFNAYIPLIQEIQNNTAAWQALYNDKMVPVVTALQQSLVKLTLASSASSSATSSAKALDLWEAFSGFRAGLTRFYEEPKDENYDEIATFLGKMEQSSKEMSAALGYDAQGRVAMNEYDKAYQAFRDFFAIAREITGKINKAVDQTMALDAAVTNEIMELNKGVDSDMAASSEATISSNDSAINTMLGASAGGTLIGIAFAAFIILGIIRVLNRVGVYASAVAGGNFQYHHGITEKGEIGSMVSALEQIPSTLSGVIDDCNTAAGKVACGDFRNRLDQEHFNGGFKDLAIAVNTVANSYTGVIDELPVSIMAMNLDRKIIFLNALAQELAGNNAIGESCGEKLKTGVCDNDQCFAIRCQQSSTTTSGETSMETSQGTMHLSVSALPIHDLAGKSVGTMEIITDITQIKEQQITMANVAHQASDISDRVAAASEQLSAQVEQVSRGAEMQRDRVESTASAMSEMNSTVLEVARNAGQAAEQGDSTRASAQEGAVIVEQVVSAITNVNKTAIRLQEVMTGLGGQATNIGSVMNVISDVADQTNLLALNAAIEAARAGEAGRGFAVVADEVRKLAEKTMQATQEIGSNITAIQQSTQASISEVSEAVEGVSKATELANASGEALKGIVDIASATSSIVAAIATAAEQQSATSNEITQAIDEINRIVGETSEGMIQSSQAVQDLSRMAQELKRVLDNLQ